MLKIGIIGCGKQADAHASLIHKLSNCEIVGVCDREELMAKQLCERFDASYYCDDVNKLLDTAAPDVVHVITPPQSHLKLGRICLEAGCSVFFEKPFCMNASEAEKLINFALRRNLKLTVGHNNQFSQKAIEMRKLVEKGFLGGDPIHMESVWGYDLSDQRFARALLGDRTHWIRSLPGKLLHNIISHGICKIAEFINTDNPRVIAHGFTSPLLQNIGETDIVDELRVIIDSGNNMTAYFTFSSQIKPLIRQFRLFGSQNSLIIDDMHHTLIKISRTNYKSYLNHFVPPAIYAKQNMANSIHNIKNFITRDLHFDSGRKCLIESFYQSVLSNTPLPISYKEILLTSKIMDAIFEQISS